MQYRNAIPLYIKKCSGILLPKTAYLFLILPIIASICHLTEVHNLPIFDNKVDCCLQDLYYNLL